MFALTTVYSPITTSFHHLHSSENDSFRPLESRRDAGPNTVVSVLVAPAGLLIHSSLLLLDLMVGRSIRITCSSDRSPLRMVPRLLQGNT